MIYNCPTTGEDCAMAPNPEDTELIERLAERFELCQPHGDENRLAAYCGSLIFSLKEVAQLASRGED